MRLLTWVVRVFLGVTFVVGGLPKALGQPWHRLTYEPWIVPFFEALQGSGIYWNFLGISQMAAGLVILTPRLTTLGALAYLPILLNVVVISISLPFNHSVIAFTLCMLAGNLFLLAKDLDRLLPLVAPIERTT